MFKEVNLIDIMIFTKIPLKKTSKLQLDVYITCMKDFAQIFVHRVIESTRGMCSKGLKKVETSL